MIKAGRPTLVFWTAVLMSLCISCSKEEAGDIGNYPIGFHCAVTGTKAFVTSENIETEGNSFKVFAHIGFGSVGTTSSFNRIVSYLSGDWKYEDEQYWIPGGDYLFRAYYPADFPAVISETDKSNYSFAGYSIESVPDKQIDILMAEARRSTENVSVDGPVVRFTFNHLLSNINLKLAATENLAVEVLGVGFRGVAKTADYLNGAWANHRGTTDLGNNINLILDSEGAPVPAFDGGLLAIPQSISENEVFVLVTANITLPNGNVLQSKQFNLALPAVEWKSGQKYTYTATITADFNILFDEPEVEPWGEEKMSGIVIIK